MSSPSCSDTNDGRMRPPTTSTLVPVTDVPRFKRARHTSSLYMPGPETHLALPGRLALTQAPSLPSSVPSSPTTEDADLGAYGDDLDDVFLDQPDPLLIIDGGHSHKAIRQWSTWTTQVIPSLVRPHLQLLRETKNLRNPVPVPNNLPACTCSSESRSLKIVVLHFDSRYLIFSVSWLIDTPSRA